MKNILIINLRKLGDVFTTGHLITSLKAKYPSAKIHFLVYKESENAAALLADIFQVVAIDRKKMATLGSKKIFNKAFSIETLLDTFSVLPETFDLVINHSNDLVATLLTAYFSENSTDWAGIRFNSKDIVEYSGNWSVAYNDLSSEFANSYFNYVDLIHKIVGIPPSRQRSRLKDSQSHTKAWDGVLNKIRSENLSTSELKFIGISPFSSSDSKDIPLGCLEELFSQIYDDLNLFPILIIAPSAKERMAAEELNKRLGNGLVTVEADFLATTSILQQINFLVTCDSSIKHLADLNKVPLLEINYGVTSFSKQGPSSKNSLILCFNSNQALSQSQDIYASMKFSLDAIPHEHLHLGNGALFRTTCDSLGTKYEHVTGLLKIEQQVRYEMGRAIAFGLCNNVDIPRPHIAFCTGLEEILRTQANSFQFILKSILHLLRELPELETKNKRCETFISELSALFTNLSEDNLFSIPLIIWRTQLSLLSDNLFDNRKLFEKSIFELKNNCLKVDNFLRSIANNLDQQQEADLGRKYLSVL